MTWIDSGEKRIIKTQDSLSRLPKSAVKKNRPENGFQCIGKNRWAAKPTASQFPFA